MTGGAKWGGRGVAEGMKAEGYRERKGKGERWKGRRGVGARRRKE